MDVDAWRARLVEDRRNKDHHFKDDPRSPLGDDQREGFEGLAYYTPSPGYVFEATLREDEPRAVPIPRSAGDEVTYVRVGTFRLKLPTGKVELAAFRTADHDDGALFIPFRDATSGRDTYGAGRYLEAEPLGGGRYRVDLNRAYHPYCAYDEGFTCPLPAHENHLDVPVEAGERLPAPRARADHGQARVSAHADAHAH